MLQIRNVSKPLCMDYSPQHACTFIRYGDQEIGGPKPMASTGFDDADVMCDLRSPEWAARLPFVFDQIVRVRDPAKHSQPNETKKKQHQILI